MLASAFAWAERTPDARYRHATFGCLFAAIGPVRHPYRRRDRFCRAWRPALPELCDFCRKPRLAVRLGCPLARRRGDPLRAPLCGGNRLVDPRRGAVDDCRRLSVRDLARRVL